VIILEFHRDDVWNDPPLMLYQKALTISMIFAVHTPIGRQLSIEFDDIDGCSSPVPLGIAPSSL
jgi:hypothetical protein